MGVGVVGPMHPVRLLWCLILGMAIMCQARNHVTLSGHGEMRVEEEGIGRSLKGASLDDYTEPSANQGHDPRSRDSPGISGSGSGSGSGPAFGRKNRGSPDTP